LTAAGFSTTPASGKKHLAYLFISLNDRVAEIGFTTRTQAGQGVGRLVQIPAVRDAKPVQSCVLTCVWPQLRHILYHDDTRYDHLDADTAEDDDLEHLEDKRCGDLWSARSRRKSIKCIHLTLPAADGPRPRISKSLTCTSTSTLRTWTSS
jgi:hypothetical protein